MSHSQTHEKTPGNPSYRIGLLGGIGPVASGKFYQSVIQKLQQSGRVKANTDFPQIIMNSIPAPELTSLQIDEKLLEPYIEGVKLLNMHRPDLILMICNTVHLYYDLIHKRSGAKNLISIREVVEQRLQYLKQKTICIIGSPQTIISNLYRFKSLTYLEHKPADLKLLGTLINSYNASGDDISARSILKAFIAGKKREGTEVFVLACTELSMLARGIIDLEFQYEDTLEMMVEEVVERCLENKIS